MVTLFAAAMFVNALLLFLVQPMFARLLLPLFGGSPAVWTTCMLFFQSALLAGYAYSHSLVKLRKPWQQALIHILVIALPILTLPISLSMGSSTADGSPIASVLRLSTIAVGAPFFALATSAPLLQRWFASSQGRKPVDPYFLYAASNVGSFASLILYPTLVEPVFALSTQTRIWSVGYGIAVAVTVVCAIVMWRRAPEAVTGAADRTDEVREVVPWGRRLRWTALAFVPSSLMLAVTAYLSTDVAAVPLLWVIPLALYLITFVITFSGYGRRTVAVCARYFPLILLVLTFLIVSETQLPLVSMAGAHLIAFFVIAILCHGTLAEERPATSHLTGFYLSLSVGGALGGVFNSLLAPLMFRTVLEYPLALAAAVVLLTFRPGTKPLLGGRWWWLRPAIAAALTLVSLKSPGVDLTVAKVWVMMGVAIVVAFSLSEHPRRLGVAVAGMLAIYVGIGGQGFANVVHASRTFFGTYRVASDAERRSYTLFHGTTIHGRQNVSSDEPLTYYHRRSPIAQVFDSRAEGSMKAIGAVGLGTGTLAAYAQPGQRWMFYEIDPEVERIARDTRYFTHLRRCGERCQVVIGDARLSLKQRPETHDVIVLDAFSSDAIPIHLLTREAVELYLSRLNPDGVLAIHISNNHLDLAPVVAEVMSDLGLVGRVQFQPGPKDLSSGVFGSQWSVLARSDGALGPLAHDKRWVPLQRRNARTWTDDFSNIWSTIRWRN